MSIPKYDELMLPLLKLASDRSKHTLSEAIEYLRQEFGLSEEEYRDMLPSGRQSRFQNRVGWARTYLNKAGLLMIPDRGMMEITQRGIDVLKRNPISISKKYLLEFPEFMAFQSRTPSAVTVEANELTSEDKTPEESLEEGCAEFRSQLKIDLLDRIKEETPDFFERLVVDLLVKMGYGGSRKDAGRAVGRSGDGGIDGVIKDDRLGLEVIYIQAKRWKDSNSVGRPEVQKFAGSLDMHHASKGVFITTSSFSKEALDFVTMIEKKIVLIDGEMLAELMIDHNLGVSTVSTYEIKRIDSDYFIED